jgi:hypothetical protein
VPHKNDLGLGRRLALAFVDRLLLRSPCSWGQVRNAEP